jgi:hypothetical protein
MDRFQLDVVAGLCARLGGISPILCLSSHIVRFKASGHKSKRFQVDPQKALYAAHRQKLLQIDGRDEVHLEIVKQSPPFRDKK